MNCIFTVLHPKSKNFFLNFIESVNSQTASNFFLFLCLNNVTIEKKKISKIKCKYFLFKVNTNPGAARKKAFDKLKEFKTKNIIFVDSDDILKKKRLEFDLEKLKNNDFVVTNLRKINKSGLVLKKDSMFDNIGNNQEITYNLIKDTNFIGFSNLSIRSKVFFKVNKFLNFSLVALDWALAKILVINLYKGRFYKKTLTYYRQYDDNIATGLNDANFKDIRFIIKVKLEHYLFFQKKFNCDYSLMISLLKLVDKKKLQCKIIKKNNLWWNINILKS